MNYPRPGTFASDQPRDHDHGKRRSRANNFHAGYDLGLNGRVWKMTCSDAIWEGNALGLERYRRMQEMP